MFEQLLSSATALRRHQDGPFAAERERYLQHCSDSGATYWSLRIKCNELLWAAKLLDLQIHMCGLQARICYVDPGFPALTQHFFGRNILWDM